MSKKQTMDGNQAAAYASYAFTEVATIFPITPSSPMAEHTDEWAAKGKKNIFGQPVRVVEMQSEAGAAGAMHGSLQAGALTTTYTASQGLLLMIPNLYKMAGELLPGVLHVSARALAAHALSIFGDHQDVMACRQTGVAMLCASSVQEVMDLAAVSHLSSIKSRIPFIHYFDGFRTSHEIQKIDVLDYEDIAKLVDYDAVREFRNRALNPEHPVIRGTAQNPDIYFQGREASNKFYDAVPGIVTNYMKEIEKITGRKYNAFDYYGASDAEYVIVAMGSACETIEETIDYLVGKGEKVGLVKVRLYRPFVKQLFMDAMPKTVKKIAVLDRTKEPGSIGEPLYLDITKVYYDEASQPLIIGGRYGLGSKDTTPSQIIAVYNNLMSKEPKNYFTVGINDDVTHTSLPEGEPIETTPQGTINCKFWGLGSDGTVGANKSAIKIIGDNTDMYAQAYFAYDSKKSGGLTLSHLRFGKQPIKSTYLINNADYIACHNRSFIHQYEILKGLKKNGTFVLNCPWDAQELESNIPADMKKFIAKNNIKFYTIDAVKIASKVGLGNRINMIMQTAFFKLSNVLPVDEAVKYLKESIVKSYGKKGQNIVDMNFAAVDQSIDSLHNVQIPAAWADAVQEPIQSTDEPEFIRKILIPMTRQEGDLLPVSAFDGIEDGTFPSGTTNYEKRGIAVNIPHWVKENCIQCGRCSYVCPHATIRLFVLDENEAKAAPESFELLQAAGKGFENYKFKVQVSPLDCTGCGNCADVCPTKEKALVMVPLENDVEKESSNFEFALTLKEKKGLMDIKTLKGSQFVKPLLEYNGACPGCGETPYIRLLTQLFGDRMMIANATGCSSIWAASAPSTSYTTNEKGRGPAWGNSLFEDNAEFGFGMYLGVKQIRAKLHDLANEAQNLSVSDELKEALAKWVDTMEDGELSQAASDELVKILEQTDRSNPVLAEIYEKKDFLTKKSFWMLGGDGWAYDIGYGGLDHVIASGEDVNIFVMDTEIYSNTGGQSSKATPTAAVAKFAAAGKKIRKKDLGMMAMSYGYVYVAQIAMGANMNQTIKAITEAEKYKGPSIIIAYAPCISHGIKTGMGTSMKEENKAVEAGYWSLYRFNPELYDEGKNPLVVESKDPTASFKDFIKGEIRYTSLINTFPEEAEDMFDKAEMHARQKRELYKKLADLK